MAIHVGDIWSAIGLRARFIALALAALLPLAFGWVLEIRSDIQKEIDATRQQVLSVARLVADRKQETLVKTQALLDVISRIPEVTSGSGSACHRALKDISDRAPWQSALWVVAPDGTALCGSLSPNLSLNIADRDYFREALATKSFTVSDYVRTRLRRHPALVLARPILNEGGEVKVVVLATVDVAHVTDPMRVAASRQNALLMIDKSGKILDWDLGKGAELTATEVDALPRLALSDKITALTGNEPTTLDDMGPDGIERIWGVLRIDRTGAHVAIGIPKADVVMRGREAMRDSLIWTAIVAFAAVLLAWLGGEIFLLRNLSTLANAADRIGTGDLTARSNLPRSAGELRIVGKALDGMAERLRERNEEIAENGKLLQRTLENMDQGLLMFDKDQKIQMWNGRVIELLGLPSELMRKGTSFSALREYQISTNEFSRTPRHLLKQFEAGDVMVGPVYERERPNGTVLEIRTVPLPEGGAVKTFTDITARKEAERKIAHMASHDPLTGLPNRSVLNDRLTHHLALTRRSGKPVTLLCLDLDRFKVVNDSLGHPAGDMLLQLVGERLRASLREEDTVARLGGDEFAIIQVGSGLPRGTNVLAERLIEAMAEPFSINGSTVNIGISIGIAIAPVDGSTAEELLRNADLALYRAKNEGRNTFRYFEEEMDLVMRQRRALEMDLREAVNNGSFELVYQPVVDINDRRITAFEALLRWRHPERGLLSASDFIPIAEETHLIGSIGSWVLAEACREAINWPSHVRLAVNVSVMQFRSSFFVAGVVQALTNSGLSPSRLEIEITETALIENDESIIATLNQLRTLGVHIALDDFGTGFSSLSHLRRFPFDRIKIDKSFVSELDLPASSAVISAVTTMGRHLSIPTVAEGVETPAQLERLKEEGCTEAQGFLFSPPVSASEIPNLFPGRRPSAVA